MSSNSQPNRDQDPADRDQDQDARRLQAASGQDAVSGDEGWGELADLVDCAWPVDRWRDVGVVVGCSGGADSVALVELLQELRCRGVCRDGIAPGRSPAEAPRGFLVVAHFHHGLRGQEADADEDHVRQLANRHQLEFAVGRAVANGKSDEATLRRQRMEFLTATCNTSGARYLALAHTSDDNVETVLHHLFRGTGPSGLAGIGSPRSVGEDLVLVRPLLEAGRDRLRQVLRQRGVAWREDSSNLDSRYRRNWIRHELLPLIQQEYPHAKDAVIRAIEGQREWRGLVDRLADHWIEANRRSDDPLQLSRSDGDEAAVVVAALQKLWAAKGWPRRDMTRVHWLRLASTLLGDDRVRLTLPAGIDVDARGDVILLSRPKESKDHSSGSIE